jgi:hypothetical protein
LKALSALGAKALENTEGKIHAPARKGSLFSLHDNETQSDTSSSEELLVSNESPFSAILALSGDSASFTIDSCAGLSGDQVVAKFPCALSDRKFFVWISETSLSLFDKHTFMNLAEFAEQKSATQIVFLLSASHPQLNDFRRTFKVLDAERVPSAQVQSIIRSDLVAKEVMLETKFYQMDL